MPLFATVGRLCVVTFRVWGIPGFDIEWKLLNVLGQCRDLP